MAERALRPGVIDRKPSFGTQSAAIFRRPVVKDFDRKLAQITADFLNPADINRVSSGWGEAVMIVDEQERCRSAPTLTCDADTCGVASLWWGNGAAIFHRG